MAKAAKPSRTNEDAAGADPSAGSTTSARVSVGGWTLAAAIGSPKPGATPAERALRGRQVRASTRRSDLARWSAPADRADPVSLVASQDSGRVAELVPVRHARMATSAFAFYRGSALIMASDLAGMPRTSLDAQLCGDAHLSNFGLFAAPDRTIVFDLNDFDETNPGPFEWDVKRLACSFVLAARDNGLPGNAGNAAAAAAGRSYRESMANFATQNELDIWYSQTDAASLTADLNRINRGRTKPSAKAARRVRRTIDDALARARSRDAWSAIAKITEVIQGHRRFREQPPLLVRIGIDAAAYNLVAGLFRQYLATLQDDRRALLQRYEIIDIGHKVVGVGSVGLLAFVILLQGRDSDDLMVLQVKQAQQSVLEAFTRRSRYGKHGRRVVAGQRLIQAASDPFLGWIQIATGSFYVRQLRDMKWSPDPGTLGPAALRNYALLCGYSLARAHARTGDAAAISAYLGGGDAFDSAIVDFAGSYADQAERDFAEFTAAVAAGRVAATEPAAGGESRQVALSVADVGLEPVPAPDSRRST